MTISGAHTTMPWTDRRAPAGYLREGDKHSVPHVDTRGRFRGYLQAFFSLIPRQLKVMPRSMPGDEERKQGRSRCSWKKAGAELYERRPGSWLS